MKLKGGEPIKLTQFLRKQQSGPRGQGPSLHKHAFQHTLEPSSAQVATRGAH